MNYLEDNYISVVVVVHNQEETVERKISNLIDVLKENFKNYELIIVDNMSNDNTINILKKMEEKLTFIELPIFNDSQSALAAGVNMAIGDYIVEIEDISVEVDYGIIMDMYKKSQEGNDFVFLTPKKNSFTSKIFYKILNANLKKIFNANISSSIITLSSRRGQNKTAEIGKRLVNRNVSYVLSGLNYFNMICEIEYINNRSFSQNFQLMMQTLIHYTDVVVKFSQNTAFIFFMISIFFIIYSIYVKFFIKSVQGWASTIVIMSVGFSGIFLMLGMIVRYLDNILKNTSDSKQYIYRSIDKK
ncbi:glycosyltransferase, group 2 family protein [Peptoanaerobacter stomatis]|uniref:Glycosyltransferase, group 2 family protein n=1 Tax=Peptoanaerobacter stomatis TaxID=796937 RepID=J5ULL1_9FIRM|nr:glycosyltransferase [Peptoanaerobacter stomatis]EJU23479.1 glycosyltransferase, group 2 family protein [Peptoanaerobacter stomatis]NWO24570.1 glycosyltransferase [Peptostreptococcaceae bacterium oral taxon 081]